MEEQSEKKVQAIALVLIVVAVVIAIGGYFYVGSRAKAGNRPRAADAGGKSARVAQQSECPTTSLGSLLQVGVTKGQARTADGGSGVAIESAESGGIGETYGLQANDVVVAADGNAVTCPKDLLSAVQESLPKGLTLSIERQGKPMDITIPAQPASQAG